LNIASYGFLLLPSSGLAMIAMGYSKYDEIELPFAKPDYMSKYAENPTGQIFLPHLMWKITILCFVVIRTAQPIILAKMDKTINNKIGVIISDDVED